MPTAPIRASRQHRNQAQGVTGQVRTTRTVVVYADDDHTLVSVATVRPSVDQPIDQALRERQPNQATAATWGE